MLAEKFDFVPCSLREDLGKPKARALCSRISRAVGGGRKEIEEDQIEARAAIPTFAQATRDSHSACGCGEGQ
jgi:hypothetical protein